MLISRLRRLGFRAIARFTLRLAALAVRRPGEAIDHVLTQVALTRTASGRTPVETVPEWRRVLHERIGARWPCDAEGEFEQLWATVASDGLPASAATNEHDADPALAEMVWCLTRHLEPRAVVETGVSRGTTSRVILEAFERTGDGHLWSVDLPPLEEPWRRLVATAVPQGLRARWTYVRGSSRRRLPAVCRRVGAIDLFIHDSLHTPGNLHFELATVWPYLRPGAAVVIDDAEDCGAVEVLRKFTQSPLLAAREGRKSASAVFVVKTGDTSRAAGDSGGAVVDVR